jgi:hypothetical protein
MSKRRPRCVCGDLYSDHDMRSQNTSYTDPCQGKVCTALASLPLDDVRQADPCDDYHPDGVIYVPLAQVLHVYGLRPADIR